MGLDILKHEKDNIEHRIKWYYRIKNRWDFNIGFYLNLQNKSSYSSNEINHYQNFIQDRINEEYK